MDNPYLPSSMIPSNCEDTSFDTSDILVFSDPSNHHNAKVQWIVGGISLPFFGWLTYAGFAYGIVLWAYIMGAFVVVAAIGWLCWLPLLIHPFQFNVEFNPIGLRVWQSKNLDCGVCYHRHDVARILIDRPVVTFGLKSCRTEKNFPGIQWTDKRVEQLEESLARHWPDVRVDRT